jgi:hypothetical protein
MKKKTEKTVVKTQVWTITQKQYSDGSTSLERKNDGFYAIELFGLCEFIKAELIDTMRGVIKPTMIKREVVQD